MIEDRMDALLRRLDVPAEPDSMFVDLSLSTMLGAADQARRSDRRPLASLWRAVDSTVRSRPSPRRMTRPMPAILLLLALLLTAIGLVVVGALRHPQPLGGPSGLVVIADDGRLEGIDVETGQSSFLLPVSDSLSTVHAVSRSPDGQLVSYRITDERGDHLEMVRTDGTGRRPVAPDVVFSGDSCNDIWSNDSRWLVAGVTVEATKHILVVDAVSGAGRFVTPSGTDAGCPIWSPDGEWVGYVTEDANGISTAIEIVRRDGSDRRVITTEHPGGLISWSRDGWIYNDTGGRIYRVRVVDGEDEPLTAPELGRTYAPALSPDGQLLTFERDNGNGLFDLYLADPDGAHPRVALADAFTLGWSTDGRYLLAVWVAPDGARTPGGLVMLRPDGTGLQVLRPFDGVRCRPQLVGACYLDVGWGQSRP